MFKGLDYPQTRTGQLSELMIKIRPAGKMAGREHREREPQGVNALGQACRRESNFAFMSRRDLAPTT